MHKYKILLVDDEIDLVEVLAFQFEDVGYSVLKAFTLHDAASKIKSESPDIVLSDMRMPGGSGLELLRECKLLPNPPYFAIFSGHTNLDIKSLKEQGVDVVLSKPISFESLMESLSGGASLKKISG